MNVAVRGWKRGPAASRCWRSGSSCLAATFIAVVRISDRRELARMSLNIHGPFHRSLPAAPGRPLRGPPRTLILAALLGRGSRGLSFPLGWQEHFPIGWHQRQPSRRDAPAFPDDAA